MAAGMSQSASSAEAADDWRDDFHRGGRPYSQSPYNSGSGKQLSTASVHSRHPVPSSSSFGSALSALSSGLSHAAAVSLPLPSSSASSLSLSSSGRLRRSLIFCMTLPLRCSKWMQQCQRRQRKGQSAWQALAHSVTPAHTGYIKQILRPLLAVTAICLLGWLVWRHVSTTVPSSAPTVDRHSLPVPMPYVSLFELYGDSDLPGYDDGDVALVESDEETYHRLLRERRCPVTDLACSVQLLPLSPLPRTASSLPTVPSSHSPAVYRLAYLLLCNSAFADMALNLLCSADAVSIARSLWLIVAADPYTFRFFTLRGFNVVLLDQTRLSEGQPAAADGDEVSGYAALQAVGATVDVGDTSEGSDGRTAASEQASSWQSRQHIDINREKIPLLHTLLSHHVDVLLFDADMVILHPVDQLFPLEPSSSFADLTIMSDYPYNVLSDLYTSDMLSCVSKNQQSTHAPCSYLWELNGGFFLLRSSSATVRLVEDMWDWLRQRPNHNDQDALRAAVKDKFYRRQLKFITDDGSAWPPYTNSFQQQQQQQQQPLDHRIALRYLPPLLAPNGGLFFLDGQQSYKDEASKVGVFEPTVLHLNWIVGYSRKLSIAQDAGLWFVVGPRAQGRCSTLRSLTRRAEHTKQQSSAADLIAHRNTTYPRLSPSTLDAASLQSLQSSLTATERSSRPNIHSLSARRWDGSSSPLFLLFSSPKPLSSFLSLPSYRAADSDGLGERVGAANLTSAELSALQADNALQVEAQLVVLRSWFGLSDGSLNLCQVLLFSDDSYHVQLADRLSFDIVTHFDADQYGAPKLHSLFRRAEYIAGRRDIPYLLYVNGDIALGIDTAETADAIAAYEFPEVLAVGSRPDFNTQLLHTAPSEYKTEMRQVRVTDPSAAPVGGAAVAVSFSRSLTDSLFNSLASKSRASSSMEALDFFLFSRGLWDWQQIPRFLLGRVGFDNWLLHWANSRKSATVIDCSNTLTALHMSHDLHKSSTMPGGMTNLRLAGQPSRRGLGSLVHAAYRTTRLSNGDIRVVRQRPDSGHLKSLFDAAEDAHMIIRHRPTLFVVTVDASFLTVFQNWLLTWRKARGNSAAGLLLLSTHPMVTEYARAQAIPAFELAQGDKAVSALNGEPTSYLQIMSLRSKAVLFLLEFGYDVFNMHVDSVWLHDPLAIIQQQARVKRGSDSVDERDGLLPATTTTLASSEGGPEMPPLTPALNGGGSVDSGGNDDVGDGQSVPPVSSSGWLGEGVDVVAFTYPSSASDCQSAVWNVSVGGLLLRHTPETLRMWRRISVEYGALVSRATMAHQINLLYLDEDWYLQFELQENEQLTFATVCNQPHSHMWRSKSFTQYRQGALVNSTEVQRRQQLHGVWLLEPNVHDSFYRSKKAPNTPPLRRLQHFPALSNDLSPHSASYVPLTSTELDMLRSIATPDSRALSVLSLHSDSCESPAVQKWLSRARQLSIQHVLLLADSAAVTQRCASSHSPISSFPVLYPPPAPYSVLNQPHLTFRLAQLLDAGFIVTLVDVDSVWFSQPLPLLADELIAPHSHSPHHAANHSNPALYACDVLGHTQRNGSLERAFIAVGPSHSARSFVALVHNCYAQHMQAVYRASELTSAERRQAGLDVAGGGVSSSLSSLPWSCVLSSSVALQRLGLLSVCQVDVDYFPSAYRLFESGDALDSGVWPVVSPARYVHPRSGRVKEFVEGWERFSNAAPIAPPNLQQQQRTDEDSRRAAEAADYSVCPPSSFDRSLRPHFTLIIKLLSFTRADSLVRLLQSLTAADYGDDRVHLDISIDRLVPPTDASARYNTSVYEAQREAHSRVVDISSRFEWPHGSKRWRIHDTHVGLVGQWLNAWMPAAHDDSTFVLILEDDMEVSRVYYHFLKAAICKYYFDPQQFDPHLYGISLQNQRHVVGHNKKLQQAMVAETKWKRAQQVAQLQQQQKEAEEAAQSSQPHNSSSTLPSSDSSALNDTLSSPPISIDMADIVDMRGKLVGSTVYRYQLVGTWGLLLFPQHWRSFVQWYREKTQPPSSSAAAVSAFTPCVPFLESSVWWARRPAAVWSQWLIRYTFERGWYCLYSHWEDDQQALAINHRERGENYRQAQGPDNKRLVDKLVDGTGGREVAVDSRLSSIQYQQQLPRLANTPLFDFYFDRVQSNGESLSQRHLLLNQRHWRQACKQQHAFNTQRAEVDTTEAAVVAAGARPAA